MHGRTHRLFFFNNQSKKCELLVLYMEWIFANLTIEIARKNLKNTPAAAQKRRLRVLQGISGVIFEKIWVFYEDKMALIPIRKSASSYCFLLLFSSGSAPTGRRRHAITRWIG